MRVLAIVRVLDVALLDRIGDESRDALLRYDARRDALSVVRTNRRGKLSACVWAGTFQELKRETSAREIRSVVVKRAKGDRPAMRMPSERAESRGYRNSERLAGCVQCVA